MRPRPHFGLLTVITLFAGAIRHRNSLGTDQSIIAGDVNWITAGAGIVHAERTVAEDRSRRNWLFGLKFWVALPQSMEEAAPHHATATLPTIDDGQIRIRLIAGTGWGLRAPVKRHPNCPIPMP